MNAMITSQLAVFNRGRPIATLIVDFFSRRERDEKFNNSLPFRISSQRIANH